MGTRPTDYEPNQRTTESQMGTRPRLRTSRERDGTGQQTLTQAPDGACEHEAPRWGVTDGTQLPHFLKSEPVARPDSLTWQAYWERLDRYSPSDSWSEGCMHGDRGCNPLQSSLRLPLSRRRPLLVSGSFPIFHGVFNGWATDALDRSLQSLQPRSSSSRLVQTISGTA